MFHGDIELHGNILRASFGIESQVVVAFEDYPRILHDVNIFLLSTASEIEGKFSYRHPSSREIGVCKKVTSSWHLVRSIL